MKPEREFADFVAQEARKRGLPYFVVVMNPDTGKFSYRTEIWIQEGQEVTPEMQAVAQTAAYIKHMFIRAGALET